MSQLGKLYKFYFGKIGQKNGIRILIFTILIGFVWGFAIPFVASKGAAKGISSNASTSEDKINIEKEINFSNSVKFLAGSDVEVEGVKYPVGIEMIGFRLKVRDWLEKSSKGNPEESGFKGTKSGWIAVFAQMLDSSNFIGLSLPFTSDNVFFFQQTDGSLAGYPDQNYTKGKTFWKLIFDIAWGNLTGFVVLYWFIFEVFDKTFFSPREDGEEAMVLTMTPGVKRGDLVGGKILAFLTFYFLINIALFLIPFGIYYFGLAPNPSWLWFSLLGLIAVIVMPLLYFLLVFASYLFFGSLLGGSKGVFSTLITFIPLIGVVLKAFTSGSGPHTVENTFFNPIGFTVISLICGIFFLTLYYLRYQEEDLS